MHHSLLILIARNVTQHFSSTLRGQNNQQEAQKCEKHGTKYTVRSLVYKWEPKPGGWRPLCSASSATCALGNPSFMLLYTCLQMAAEASWLLTQGLQIHFRVSTKNENQLYFDMYLRYRFVFINITTVAFFTSHEQYK